MAKRLSVVGVAALWALLCVALFSDVLAASGVSGVPSRLRVQSLGVGGPAPATDGRITATGLIQGQNVTATNQLNGASLNITGQASAVDYYADTYTATGAGNGFIAASGATFQGDGSGLTALDASAVSAGTLDNARLPSTINVTSLQQGGTPVCLNDGSNCAGSGQPDIYCYTGAGGCTGNIAVGQAIYVMKTANESVSSSATPQNDDDLIWTPTNAGVYEVTYVLRYYGNSTGAQGFRFCFAKDGGSDHQLLTGVSMQGGTPGAGNITGFTTSGSCTAAILGDVATSAAAYDKAFYTGIANLAASGTYRLQWAQESAANTTTLMAGSFMKFKRINAAW